MAFDPFHIQGPDGLLDALAFAEEGGDWTAGREISASQDDAAHARRHVGATLRRLPDLLHDDVSIANETSN